MANEFVIRVSDNQGNTWIIVKNDIEGYFPVGCQDPYGRVWVFYYRASKIYYIYTDEIGAVAPTWSAEAEVVLGGTTPAEGKIGCCVDHCGKLWISFWDDADNLKSAYSKDQATTWTVGDIS